MNAHVVTLQPPYDGTCVYICCSCSAEPIARVGFPEAAASLVEINHIVHEHIEAAEMDPRDIRNDTAWTGSTYGA